MRKLTFGMNQSLDGYIAAPGDDLGWSVPRDELFRWWSDRCGVRGDSYRAPPKLRVRGEAKAKSRSRTSLPGLSTTGALRAHAPPLRESGRA